MKRAMNPCQHFLHHSFVLSAWSRSKSDVHWWDSILPSLLFRKNIRKTSESKRGFDNNLSEVNRSQGNLLYGLLQKNWGSYSIKILFYSAPIVFDVSCTASIVAKTYNRKYFVREHFLKENLAGGHFVKGALAQKKMSQKNRKKIKKFPFFWEMSQK